MADYISLSLTAAADSSLNLEAYNNGREDPKCYMKVVNYSSFTLQPMEKISVLMAPQSAGLTPSVASGHLSDVTYRGDPANGIFLYRYQNTELSPKTLTELCTFTLTSVTQENVKYDLYWLQDHEGSIIFNSNVVGVYSFPHNLQPNELAFDAQLLNDNTKVRYTLTFPEINNSGSADYTTEKPYNMNISYRYGEGTVTGYFFGSAVEFADSDVYTEFDPGQPSAGIIFDLPFYDPRAGWQNVPAQYYFKINYNCADPVLTGSLPIIIPMNHQQWADSPIIALDSQVSTHTDPNKLRKVDEIFIERKTIDRKRFSIGVKDVAVVSNEYKRKGTYISKPYVTDFPIYTFSLKVDEFIPEYSNVDPYDLVQYFIEFNSKPWLRISPINRGLEIDGENKSVPKMFIFDSDSGEGSESVEFLNYQTPITVFRIKIVFDLSSVVETKFIPPEIRDYGCIVFDKNQLLGI